MSLVQVAGLELYAERSGFGEDVVLLHGGFCSLEHFRPIGEALATEFRVSAFERPGHGRSADTDGAYSYEDGLDQLIACLDLWGIKRAHLVGFSDGAIIGILAAMRHPDRVRSLVAISANLDVDAFDFGDSEEVAQVSSESGSEPVSEPDPEDAEYQQLSPDGPEHMPVVIAKLREMWTTQPQIDPAELAVIQAPTLVMAGDRDVIRADHTRLIADSISGAELCIIPDARHTLVRQRTDSVRAAIRDFLVQQPADDA